MEEKHLGSKGRLRPCGVVFVSAPCGVWVPIRAAPRGVYPTGDMGDAMGWLKGDSEHLCPVCWGGRLGEMGRSTEEAAQGTVSTGHSEGGWGIRGTPNPGGWWLCRPWGLSSWGPPRPGPCPLSLTLLGQVSGPAPLSVMSLFASAQSRLKPLRGRNPAANGWVEKSSTRQLVPPAPSVQTNFPLSGGSRPVPTHTHPRLCRCAEPSIAPSRCAEPSIPLSAPSQPLHPLGGHPGVLAPSAARGCLVPYAVPQLGDCAHTNPFIVVPETTAAANTRDSEPVAQEGTWGVPEMGVTQSLGGTWSGTGRAGPWDREGRSHPVLLPSLGRSHTGA